MNLALDGLVRDVLVAAEPRTEPQTRRRPRERDAAAIHALPGGDCPGGEHGPVPRDADDLRVEDNGGDLPVWPPLGPLRDSGNVHTARRICRRAS